MNTCHRPGFCGREPCAASTPRTSRGGQVSGPLRALLQGPVCCRAQPAGVLSLSVASAHKMPIVPPAPQASDKTRLPVLPDAPWEAAPFRSKRTSAVKKPSPRACVSSSHLHLPEGGGRPQVHLANEAGVEGALGPCATAPGQEASGRPLRSGRAGPLQEQCPQSGGPRRLQHTHRHRAHPPVIQALCS